MAPDSSNPPLPRIFKPIVDAFIAIILVIFALDTLPCTPTVIRQCLKPLLNVTGLWQGTWSLFAPIPDSRNHRLRADFTFKDGSHHTWNSPDWQQQTARQRFVGHRDSELLEKIWLDENSAAWPAFTQSLAREELARMKIDSTLERVELSVLWGDISPPEGDTWPIEPRQKLDQERLFFTLIFPETAP